jgi:hypothetical protein
LRPVGPVIFSATQRRGTAWPPGQRALVDFNNTQPDMSEGVHVNLYNNLWGTAFSQWYGDDMKFRFAIRV